MLKQPWCPHCELPLNELPGGYWLCRNCGSSFRQSEIGLESADAYERAKRILERDKEKHLPNLAIVEVDDTGIPAWKKLLSLFGFPVEEHHYGTHLAPYVSLTLLILVTSVFLSGPATQMRMALDPTQLGRDAGLNFLTYAFAHGSWGHFLGNVLFVWPFLDNSEDLLGHGRFALLIVVSAVASALLHLAYEPTSLPLVGLSGVCFAILTFYAMVLPKNRFLIAVPLVGLLAFHRRLRVSSRTLLIFFAVKEVLGAWSQVQQLTNVSHLGHLGGALTGVAFGLFFRRRYA